MIIMHLKVVSEKGNNEREERSGWEGERVNITQFVSQGRERVREGRIE